MIKTPAMGHDSAWKKADMVTIIAAMLPRSSNGLDDIGSTAGIVRVRFFLQKTEL
jgi:hypothetical protein